MRLAYTLAFIMLLDGLTTAIGISRGFSESNPLMASLGVWGMPAIKLLGTVFVLRLCLRLSDDHIKLRRTVLSILVLIQGFVVSLNVISLLIFSKGV